MSYQDKHDDEPALNVSGLLATGFCEALKCADYLYFRLDAQDILIFYIAK